jgi:hypothetical protein
MNDASDIVSAVERDIQRSEMIPVYLSIRYLVVNVKGWVTGL